MQTERNETCFNFSRCSLSYVMKLVTISEVQPIFCEKSS